MTMLTSIQPEIQRQSGSLSIEVPETTAVVAATDEQLSE